MNFDKLDETCKYFNPDLFDEIKLDYEYITQCKIKCFGSLLYFSMKAYESIINTDSIY